MRVRHADGVEGADGGAVPAMKRSRQCGSPPPSEPPELSSRPNADAAAC